MRQPDDQTDSRSAGPPLAESPDRRTRAPTARVRAQTARAAFRDRAALVPAVAAVLLSLAAGVPLAAGQANIGAADRPYRIVDGRVDQATLTGWQVYHTTCYLCHGVDAVATAQAPDLTERVAALSAGQFAAVVLDRYPIIVGFGEVSGDDLSALRERFAAEIARHERGALLMPAWRGDERVQPHLLDLYAYLRARADGALGPGMPRVLDD